MFRIFEPRSTLDKLREKYSYLMRNAFELAPADKEKSDLINDKACKILQEIRQIEDQKASEDEDNFLK